MIKMIGVWINFGFLGVPNGMVKDQGEPWLVQANEGQAIGLRSLGDQMNLYVSSMGLTIQLGLEKWVRCLEWSSKIMGCLRMEIRVKVTWAHLNMISGSWGFIDEPRAFGIVEHCGSLGINAYEMICVEHMLMN